MADIAYRTADSPVARRQTEWGAIWAGVFAVAAIWSVFGLLGASIFRVSAGGSVSPWGMGIWSIVLTMIAMYVGGRVTGHLTGVQTSRDSIACGMSMFGLSVVAAAVLVILAGTASGTSNAAVSGPYLAGVIEGAGWFGFVALFLGWLCALGGAASARTRVEREAAPVRDIRSAA
ncbi:MAG TPA: hypothetical protein VHU89_11325 [Acidobacteriaceae bacterium]|jgi:hypothetical protein|nr:hypothetical protein [Acidobacteriaceae bacterium]